MSSNTTEVRFSLRTFPDLMVLSERVERRPEHGALAREVRRLLRLALAAEKAGFTEAGLESELPAPEGPPRRRARKSSARKARPLDRDQDDLSDSRDETGREERSGSWFDDPDQAVSLDSHPPAHSSTGSSGTESASAGRVSDPARQGQGPKQRPRKTASQSGSGFGKPFVADPNCTTASSSTFMSTATPATRCRPCASCSASAAHRWIVWWPSI